MELRRSSGLLPKQKNHLTPVVAALKFTSGRPYGTYPRTQVGSSSQCSSFISPLGANRLVYVRRTTKKSRTLTCKAKAMINVDFSSPSLILGLVLISCGVFLLKLRDLQRNISRDGDIVVAAMLSIVGGTLLFQGWRLDPLLLLCQAMTASVAFWYGMETLRLRSKADGSDATGQDREGITTDAIRSEQEMNMSSFGPPPERPGFLPPGMEQQQYPWGAQDPYYARWGAPPPPDNRANNPYAETIQYDYYGNPQDVSYNDRTGYPGPPLRAEDYPTTGYPSTSQPGPSSYPMYDYPASYSEQYSDQPMGGYPPAARDVGPYTDGGMNMPVVPRAGGYPPPAGQKDVARTGPVLLPPPADSPVTPRWAPTEKVDDWE